MAITSYAYAAVWILTSSTRKNFMAELYWDDNILRCDGTSKRRTKRHRWGPADNAIGEVNAPMNPPGPGKNYTCRLDGSFCGILMPCETTWHATLEDAKEAMYATALLVIVAPEGTYDVD